MNLLQATVGHLKHTDLIGGAIAVFGGTQQPVGGMAVALKAQDRIHHMLQHLGAGDAAIFIYMTHQNDGNAVALGKLQQLHGTFPDLGDAARGRLQLGMVHGLDGIHDEHSGLQLGGGEKDAVHLRLRADQQIFLRHLQPLGPELDLGQRFLAGDIKHRLLPAEMAAGLQQQGGFSDARRAGHQHKAPLHHAAAQDPVQLADAGGKPGVLGDADVLEGDGGAPLPCAAGDGNAAPGRRPFLPQEHLLHGVPAAAGGAFPEPFRGIVAAG